jgi:hypothetical protein
VLVQSSAALANNGTGIMVKGDMALLKINLTNIKLTWVSESCFLPHNLFKFYESKLKNYSARFEVL